MFKSLRKKPEKIREKTDFKLNFHATRVPLQGWDKLVVSLIPLETGRAVAKTPRTVVKNGNCQWPDPVIESTRLLYDHSIKEYEEKSYKFVVSSGSSRAGILGEVVINLGEFASSNHPAQRALPLKNCNTGTVLHVTITCLTPRTGSSDRELDRRIKLNNEVELDEEEAEAPSGDDDPDDFDKSGNFGSGSAASLTSMGNSGAQQLQRPLKPVPSPARARLQQDPNIFQSQGSSNSLDSVEVPSTPGSNSFNGSLQGYPRGDSSVPIASLTGKFERGGNPREATSSDSNDSSPAQSSRHTHMRALSASPAVLAKDGWRESYGRPAERSHWGVQGDHSHSARGSPIAHGSKDTLRADLEAAESTIEELRMEVVSSQRQAQKLGAEVENLKQKLVTHIRHGNENGIEKSALVAERDRLKQEVELLKSAKQATQERETGVDNARWALEEAQRTIKELKEEILYDKGTINNLNLQLRKTQDSNMELVFAIKDLEDSLEQQRRESDGTSQASKNLEASLSSQNKNLVVEVATEWEQRLAAKEEEIKKLSARITNQEHESSQFLANTPFPILGSALDVDGSHVQNLQRMVKTLQQDVEELEADSKELTDENMELHSQLKMSKMELTEKIALISQLESSVSSQRDNLVAEAARNWEQRVAAREQETKELYARIASLELETSQNHTKSPDDADTDSSDVQNLQRMVKVLQQDVEELEAEMKELTDENIDLRSKMKMSKMELAEKTELIAQLETDLLPMKEREESARQLQDLMQDLRRAKIATESAEEEHETACARIVALEDELMRARQEITQVLEESENLKGLINRVELEKQEVEETLTGLKARGVEKLERAQEQEMQIALLLQQITIHAETGREMEDKITLLESVRAGLESKLLDGQEDGLLSRSRMEEMELQLSLLANDLQSLSSSKADLESKALELETEKKTREMEKEEMEVALQATKEHSDGVREELISLKMQMEKNLAAKRNLEEWASELGTVKEDLESQLADLEDRNLLLGENIAGLEAQVRKVTEERDTYKLERGLAEDRVSDLLNEKHELHAALESNLHKHKEKVTVLEVQLGAAFAELEGYKRSHHNLQQQVGQLRGEVFGHAEVRRELQDQAANLEESHTRLEETLQRVTEDQAAAVAKAASLEAKVVQLQSECQAMEMNFVSELDKLTQLHGEQKCQAEEAAEALQLLLREKTSVVESLQSEVQQLTKQLSSMHDEKVLVEAELHAQKGELEKSVHVNSWEAKAETQVMDAGFEARVQKLEAERCSLLKQEVETTARLQGVLQQVEDLREKDARSQQRLEDVERDLIASENMNESLAKIGKELAVRAQSADLLQTEVENSRNAIERLQDEKWAVEASLQEVNLETGLLQRERASLEKRVMELEEKLGEMEEIKRGKGDLEERLSKLQVEVDAVGASRLLEAELEDEKEKCRKKVQVLEDELQGKVEELSASEKALSAAERKLRERDKGENRRLASKGNATKLHTMSLSRSNSRIGPISTMSDSREAKELVELREKAKFLEGEVKSRSLDIESTKQDFKEKENKLLSKIECLELANKQLAEEGPDLGIDQLQMELTRLQNQNSVLARHEHELQLQLSTQETLQKEVERLQEVNEKLDDRLLKYKEAVREGNMLERVVSLETELAEAMEANKLYRLELRSAFSKQHNMQAVALDDVGDADKVVQQLQQQTKTLEAELRDMRERYSSMSLRFAEVEAQREELVMTVRSLRKPRKH